MRMKVIAGCGFLLNTIFFATYYSVTKEALGRIDPIIFTFFEMVSLAPAGLLIILFSWKNVTRAVVKRGVLLGSALCLSLFTIAIALKYTTATSTAFFPALNGFVAALIARAFFREPMTKRTWVAGTFSVAGAAVLILTSSIGNLRGTLIAFLGGLFYTGYVFLSDHEQKNETAHWPLFGVELLTTAVWANLVALLFGDWQALHPSLPKDIMVVLYVAFACTFVSTLITVLLQKYISPVTVSFIYILEPVLGAIIANIYLGEVLTVQGYVGGMLVVLGSVISVWGSLGQGAGKEAIQSGGLRRKGQRSASLGSALLYPGLGCVVGALVLLKIGGMPPQAWSELYSHWSQIARDLQQGQSTYVVLLLVQASGWLVAWVSVLLMGGLACFNLLTLNLTSPASRSAVKRASLPPSNPLQPGPQARRVQSVRVSTPPLARPVQTQPAQPTRVLPPQPRTTNSLPAVQPQRPRVTTRLPGVQPQPSQPPQRIVEHPTWYGDAVWNRIAVIGLGPDTPPPVTEPLPIDQMQTQGMQYHQMHLPSSVPLDQIQTQSMPFSEVGESV